MPLEKVLIDDCENSWDSEQGANVVCTADADHKVGTKSAKMAISAGIGAGLLATQDIVAGATDYSGCHKTRKWIKTSIDTTAGQLQLLLDATADCPTPEENLDVPALVANTWSLVDIALANPASDGAIVSVGIAQTDELGAFDVYLDDINACIVTPEYQRRQIMYGGKTYENEDAAAADTARRFETIPKKLNDVIIQVTTNDQLFGDAANQRYLVAAGEAIGLSQVDVSTLYFKNAAPGQNGTVNILGVEE